MNILTKREYYWKKFLMTWIVPNYARSRGVAFWVFKTKEWWSYEMTTLYSNSFLSNVLKKLDEFKKKVTPWLYYARNFIVFCEEKTETKLLDFKSNTVFFRTRSDEHRYYRLDVSLFGEVTLTQTIFRDKSGKANNAFIASFFGHSLKSEVKLLWKGHILTKKQYFKAREEVMKFTEMEWDYNWIKLEDFVEKWIPMIDAPMMSESSMIGWRVEDILVPEKEDLTYEERSNKISEMIDKMNVKEAITVVREAIAAAKETIAKRDNIK